MAEEQGTTPQTSTTPSAPPSQKPPRPPIGTAESRSTTAQQATPSAQQPGQNADTTKPEKPADAAQSVLKEIADKLREAAPSVASIDKQLAHNVERLAAGIGDPVRTNQRSFQHELAYAVQDVEKVGGSKLPLSDHARGAVTKLAESAPGLENRRLTELLSSTTVIGDCKLVNDIRRAANDIGRQADQNTTHIRDRIDVLENRARVAERATAFTEAPQPSRPATETSAKQVAADPSEKPSQQPNQTRRQDFGGRPNSDKPIIVETGFTGALMDGIFRAMRPLAGNGSPLEPAAQPFGSRLAAFEDKTRDDQTLRGAERSGRAALDALEGFRTGEGAAVMNRINEAAKTDPGGMAGVLSEMRDGGKFADLRQQFNSALSDERGASAAYDKAASSLVRYGEDRKSVEQIIAKRPDATNLSAKFEAMDQEIGKAASEVPSRRDGKNMLDDLSKQVAEMLQRAFEGVRNMFRGATAGASQGASPSAGPG